MIWPTLPSSDDPANLTVSPAPADIALFHAMDEALFEIALQYNNGDLRVATLPGGVSSPPLYFAPGIDANPLVPTSNPVDIADEIVAGGRNSATVDGIFGFATDLFDARTIDINVFRSIIARSPSQLVRVVKSNTSFIDTSYRPVDDSLNFADEFISAPSVRVSASTYVSLMSQEHSFLAGGHVASDVTA